MKPSIIITLALKVPARLGYLYCVRARYQGKLELLNDYYHGKYFIYNYYHNESWRTEFLKHYNLVLETERYLLFERVA